MNVLNKYGLHCSKENFDPISLNPEQIVLTITYVTYCKTIILCSKQSKKSKGIQQKCVFVDILGDQLKAALFILAGLAHASGLAGC